MEFPIVTEKDIDVAEARPTAGDIVYGSYRLIGNYSYSADCRINKQEEAGLRFSLRDEATRLIKIRILRKLYPKEIGREIHDIRNHFCSMPSSYIRYDVARELDERLHALEAALQPGVK